MKELTSGKYRRTTINKWNFDAACCVSGLTVFANDGSTEANNMSCKRATKLLTKHMSLRML